MYSYIKYSEILLTKKKFNYVTHELDSTLAPILSNTTIINSKQTHWSATPSLLPKLEFQGQTSQR